MLAWSVDLDGAGSAEVRFSERHDGDFSDIEAQRPLPLTPGAWTRPRQQHGTGVLRVRAPGDRHGEAGDAAVTAASGAVVSVATADCAPVALVAKEGIVGAVHAGWRGLAAGVLEAAAATMRELGAGSLTAVVGPCIHPECYRFGRSDLAGLVERLGPKVASLTAEGAPALDVPAAVRVSLDRAGVDHVIEAGRCTACEPDSWFSHRARGEGARHLLATWITPAPARR